MFFFVAPFLGRARHRMTVKRTFSGSRRGLLHDLFSRRGVWLAATPSKSGKPKDAERDQGKRPERKDDKGFQKDSGKAPKRDK
jgi:hypothetical protein